MDATGCTVEIATPDMGTGLAFARAGERLAAAHLLTGHGLALVATNLRVSVEGLRGELDVVVTDGRTGLLVVCEVKSRTAATGAGAAETLSPRQQQRIRRMTGLLLANRTLVARGVRFDLVTVDRPARGTGASVTLRHLAGAW